MVDQWTTPYAVRCPLSSGLALLPLPRYPAAPLDAARIPRLAHRPSGRRHAPRHRTGATRFHVAIPRCRRNGVSKTAARTMMPGTVSVTAPTTQPTVELRGLAKRFGAVQALRGVELVLHPG